MIPFLLLLNPESQRSQEWGDMFSWALACLAKTAQDLSATEWVRAS